MLNKTLFAAALVVATLTIPALTPQKADAQIFFRGPRFGVSVGTPYYYGGGYYGGYYGGYRPSYYYPSYRYYNRGFYNYGNYPRYYGRYWR